MRKKLYDVLTSPKEENIISKIYDDVMLVVIVLSIIPLGFKIQPTWTIRLDIICASIFIIDYLLRWSVSDLMYPKRGYRAFLIYPFTPFAIIDLLSIIPTFSQLNKGFKLLRVFRLGRTLRVIKVLRYSENLGLVINVLKAQKRVLLSVAYVSVGYIIFAALVMFQTEPDSFNTLLDALYWATTSLTTIGYGDIYPVTNIGKIVSMVSSFVGIAIVALPSGILTAGYLNEVNKKK